MKNKPIFILDTNVVKSKRNPFKQFDKESIQYEIYFSEYVIKEIEKQKIKKHPFSKEYKVLKSGSIVNKKTFEEIIESAFEKQPLIADKNGKIGFKDTLIWLQIKKSSSLRRRKSIDIYFVTNDRSFLDAKDKMGSEFKKENGQKITILSQQDINFDLMKLYRDEINISRDDMEKIKSLIKEDKEKILLRSIQIIEKMNDLTPPSVGEKEEYEYLFFREHRLHDGQDDIYIEDTNDPNIFTVSIILSAECVALTRDAKDIFSKIPDYNNIFQEAKKANIKSNTLTHSNNFDIHSGTIQKTLFNSILANNSNTVDRLLALGEKKFYCTLTINTQKDIVEVLEIDPAY